MFKSYYSIKKNCGEKREKLSYLQESRGEETKYQFLYIHIIYILW